MSYLGVLMSCLRVMGMLVVILIDVLKELHYQSVLEDSSLPYLVKQKEASKTQYLVMGFLLQRQSVSILVKLMTMWEKKVLQKVSCLVDSRKSGMTVYLARTMSSYLT